MNKEKIYKAAKEIERQSIALYDLRDQKRLFENLETILMECFGEGNEEKRWVYYFKDKNGEYVIGKSHFHYIRFLKRIADHKITEINDEFDSLSKEEKIKYIKEGHEKEEKEFLKRLKEGEKNV